ncbi:NUDIX hydrolase [Echinimonas agarilytica]|uniref:NUDIX hydrolase n=1 Tax=Echinimonas agarilytica TaxID=1215918 RepID=A0AA41W4M1_9GAMM|nr:NUDIX domain-containing protein [Echinimonas agarilytica]MCM2678569.1 NUDIX hydrolase [Echinimonas agarilytica]
MSDSQDTVTDHDKVFFYGSLTDLPDNVIHTLTNDSVVFGCSDDGLKVLLVRHSEGDSAGEWALPGGWVRYNESVEQSAARLLNNLTGLEDIFLEQLHVFSSVNRLPHRRVITAAFYALVRPNDHAIAAGYSTNDVQWVPVSNLPNLIYDHADIIQTAVKRLRHKVRHEPIGFNLLNRKFTLLQLQELYEAILGVTLDKPNFRRKMLKMNLLKQCNEKQQGVSHRAANLYEFDEDVYSKLTEQGFSFDV